MDSLVDRPSPVTCSVTGAIRPGWSRVLRLAGFPVRTVLVPVPSTPATPVKCSRADWICPVVWWPRVKARPAGCWSSSTTRLAPTLFVVSCRVRPAASSCGSAAWGRAASGEPFGGAAAECASVADAAGPAAIPAAARLLRAEGYGVSSSEPATKDGEHDTASMLDDVRRRLLRGNKIKPWSWISVPGRHPTNLGIAFHECTCGGVDPHTLCQFDEGEVRKFRRHLDVVGGLTLLQRHPELW